MIVAHFDMGEAGDLRRPTNNLRFFCFRSMPYALPGYAFFQRAQLITVTQIHQRVLSESYPVLTLYRNGLIDRALCTLQWTPAS